jgi:hypothetical protein
MKIHRLILFGLMLVLAGDHVQAQTPIWSHAVLIGGAAADLITTRTAIHHGAHETGAAGNSIKPQIGVLALHIGAVEGLSFAANRDGHPTMARNNLLVHGLFHVGLAFWNIHVTREQIRRHR